MNVKHLQPVPRPLGSSLRRSLRPSIRLWVGLGLCLTSLVVVGCSGSNAGGTAQPVCSPPCPAGTTCTSDGCAVPGAAVRDLGTGPLDLGGCQPACSGPTSHCSPSGTCVACLVDGDCPLGSVCRSSGAVTVCAPGCKSDDRCVAAMGGMARCCGGACVDTAIDPGHCGGCGMACSLSHAVAVCSGGTCGAGACAPGWGDCNKNLADGCETNLLVDPNNCSTCGTVCKIANAVPACGGGCYIAACRFGYDDCDAQLANGCETNVVADIKNCGSCGHSCDRPSHATVGCINAACQLTGCDPGFADCNGNPKDGCEVAVAIDSMNCGVCGNSCGQGLVCKNGGCTCPQCNFPHATSKCKNQVCIIDQCNKGFGDCNGDPKDGCEVDLSSDVKNCGACGMACAMGLYCIDSVCTMTTCGDGMLQGNEEYDPPPGPFMNVQVDKVTCRWHFENVSQLYCNGTCSWAGPMGCDQADADVFCQLRTGNPLSTATKFTLSVADNNPGFPCPGGNYGKLIGKLPTRGINFNVYYQDSSIVANHGQGQTVTNPDCTNP